MVLADTSVWIEHLRHRHSALAERLEAGEILIHPFITGELACGNLKDRTEILSDLMSLPSARFASHAEVLSLVTHRKLWGRGLGWVDTHLLASALLSESSLWTLDKKLGQAASDLGLD